MASDPVQCCAILKRASPCDSWSEISNNKYDDDRCVRRRPDTEPAPPIASDHHQCRVCRKSQKHPQQNSTNTPPTTPNRLLIKLKTFVSLFINILVNQCPSKRSAKNYIYKWSSLGVHRNVMTLLIVAISLSTICAASERSSRSFSEKSTPRHDSDNAAKNGYSKPMFGQTTCNSCMLREELRERNLEFIKSQVLLKLGFTQAPNITGKTLPKYNAERMREIMELAAREESFRNPSYWSSDHNASGMQGDDPNSGIYQHDDDGVESKYTDWQNAYVPEWKEGVRVHEEDADHFHAKTEKVITFAQPYPRLRHGWKGHDILQFKFSDKIMKHKVTKATLYVYVKPPKLSSVGKNRTKRSVVIKANEQGVLETNTNRVNVGQETDSLSRETNGATRESTGRKKRSPRKDEYESGSKKVDMKSRGDAHQEYKVSVFKVVRNPKNPDTPNFELVSSITFPKSSIGKGKWKTLDISSMLSAWFKSPRENQGFVVHGTDSNGHKIVVNTVSDAEDDSKTPFAETFVVEDDGRRRRTRSTIGLDCNENSDETRCCRYPLMVDFLEFGWDWIIAPKQYAANYCSGECGYVFLQKYPHTHIASMVNPLQSGHGPAVEACCAPRKMSAISMLYFDSELNIIYGILPNMVVERCGCV